MGKVASPYDRKSSAPMSSFKFPTPEWQESVKVKASQPLA